MNLYRFDTHVHTSETSPCGSICSSDLVQLYKEAGYHGVVITDHYCSVYFESLGYISWEQKIDIFLEGFRNALLEGKKAGLQVLLGMEIRFDENWNDYLVFGIDETFLKEHKELYKLGLKKFKELIKDKDILIYQAHPFRTGIIPADHELLDGVEAFNGNLRHNSRNRSALAYAEKYNLSVLSGSDFHEIEDLARGGIILQDPICTSQDFIQILMENRILELISSE